MEPQHLPKHFAELGLRLELASRPIVRGLRNGGNEVVQIDIQRNGRDEKFRLYAGADDNRIEVVSKDKKLSQLVLMVEEGKRAFEEEVPRWTVNQAKRQAETSGEDWIDVLCRDNRVERSDIRLRGDGTSSGVFVSRRAGGKRHFLMGFDERAHPFVAQLPRPVTTVRDAHAALKPAEVASGTIRQGEWFFVKPSKADVDELEARLGKKRLTIERKVPIGPFYFGEIRGPRVRQMRGNAHTADELVCVIDVKRARHIFARGSVRHVDHDAVKLPSWHKVIKNTEPMTATGIGWVD